MIKLRFYGSDPGTVVDVSRGNIDSFYVKYAGKSKGLTDTEKAQAVLSSLLEGPTSEETANGIRSAIPFGTRYNTLSNNQGMVVIDFSKDIIKNGFGDGQIDAISEQLRVAFQNTGSINGIDYTIEGKSPAYYYPDTGSLVSQLKTVANKSKLSALAGITPSNVSKVVPKPTNGLSGRNIFIAPSHGYYTTGSGAWVLQRPSLYTMAEDYSSAALVNFYMIPMLENAGAFVVSPKERDTQIKEVLVDNSDGTGNPTNGTYTESGSWSNSTPGTGFANGLTPYTNGTNPFSLGSTRLSLVSPTETARATWTPNISAEGDYAVYVSYNKNTTTQAPDAHYYITHTGGTTQMVVNQRIDGQSWLYLGTYHFDTGLNTSKGSVYLVNISTTSGNYVSADAVKFGGGFGLITRGTGTSGHFKYTEGARYFSQYLGASTTVYDVSDTDYNDDISTRGELCNWYTGAPSGINANRNDPGQGIPIDAMVSFHSDAGSYQTKIHGSLTLWYPYGQLGDTTFPDGRSRQLNYTLASTIHYQTISDMRALYTSTWPDGGFINGNYGECRRANVPSIIVESFSHENMNDMMYALNPQFRHDLARATYKGILRFLAFQNSTSYVIMPLPPKDLTVTNVGNGNLKLTWQSTADPLESTATTVGYVVYRSMDGKGFDNGTLAGSTTLVVTGLQANTIYYFRVSAYNTGGESFPTEVLSARTKTSGLSNVLIVNGFERISAPEANVDTTGFTRADPGVWPKFNAVLSGDQTTFVPQANASHGVSNLTKVNTQELGNSFNYVIQHGKAIANAGYWFDSASKKSVEDGFIQLTSYNIVDWIAGEQHEVKPPLMQSSWTGYPDRMTPQFKTFNASLQSKVSTYLSLGNHFFVSGAYLAWDLDGGAHATVSDRAFLNNVLHVSYVTNDATNTNFADGTTGGIFQGTTGIYFDYGTSGIYGVEQPDGMLPLSSNATTSLVYTGTSYIAASQYNPGAGGRVFAMGFPFETIVSEANRNLLMSRILYFFQTGVPVELSEFDVAP